MSESTERPAAQQPASEPTSAPASKQPTQPEQPEATTVDVRELVYRGGYSGNPREIVENPAVAPEMLEPAPEDIRDDLMPKGDED